jgi:hypothetical protein
METIPNAGEVIFFQKDGWLVTQNRISTPHETLRIADVQRIELKAGDNSLSLKNRVVFSLLALGGCVVYLLLNGFTLRWRHIFVCAMPLVVWFIFAGEPELYCCLVAHCKTGPVRLATTYGSHTPLQAKSELQEIAKAIGQAMENSKL